MTEALDEGLKIHPSRGPRGFVGKNGKLTGLETIHCTSVFDAQHRFNPVFEPGTESVLDVDTAILAIGQTSDLSFLKPQDGVETTRQGTVKIDPDTLKTTAPGVFAAGDIAFGPRLIISAVADGKKAAEEIDRYLQGAGLEAPTSLRADYGARPSPDGGELRRILAPHRPHHSARPPHRRGGSGDRLHRGTSSRGSFPLPQVLDQYDF